MAYNPFSAFATWLEKLEVGRKTPAFGLAIVQGDAVATLCLGEAALGAGCSIHPDTLFRVGSVTKLFTSALIIQLVEQGVLDLDVPIAAYAPDLRFSQPQVAEQMTLRMLLSHTAGLPTGLSYRVHHVPNALAAYIERDFPNLPFVAPIGTLHYYSNHGINLAAYIAQRVTQTPYEQLVHHWVFRPAGMKTATFDPLQAMTYPLALAHDYEANGSLIVRRPFHDNPAMRPCGFALASLNDLVAFARWWMQTPSVFTVMTQAHADLLTYDHAAYGLGTRLYRHHGIEIAGHTGAIDKYGAQLWCVPEHQLAVVMLCNYAPPNWDTMKAFCHAIFDAYLPTDVGMTNTPRPATHTLPQTGFYLGDEVGLVSVQADEQGGYIDWHQAIYRLRPLRENVFIAQNEALAPVSVGFEENGWLRLNGSPCRPLSALPEYSDFPAARYGVYHGDLDALAIQQEGEVITVYSHDEQAEVLASVLDDRTIACPYGLLEWLDDDTVRWANAYILRRI